MKQPTSTKTTESAESRKSMS